MLKQFPTTHGELYFGSYPDSEKLQELKNSNITVIWNLAHELFDLAEEEGSLFESIVFSAIADYNIPLKPTKFQKEVDTICDYLKDNRKVFVHCFGGRGRTGMALAVIAKVLNNVDSDMALNLAKEYCDGPEVSKQVDFVKEF